MPIHIATALIDGTAQFCLVQGTEVISSHPTIKEAIDARRALVLPLPDRPLSDDDEELAAVQVLPVAEKTARLAALYATELILRWRTSMELSEKMAPSSTRNLTKPPPEGPPSNN